MERIRNWRIRRMLRKTGLAQPVWVITPRPGRLSVDERVALERWAKERRRRFSKSS
jgi:hypothetical protein